MKKFVSMLAIATFALAFTACDDDDDATPDGPTVTAPGVTNVAVGSTTDIAFTLTIPGGYKSLSVTATGGTAEKKSEPQVGATSGSAEITFTADANAGAGAVTITVVDNNDKSESETAAINKTAEDVPEVIVVSGVIGENTTWTSNNIYELAGRVIVDDGATLTIEEGTVIKGRQGQGINASALMIARGGTLNANGTAENPIIMTSVLDDIMPGQVSGSNLDQNDKGLWGGLVILGRAPISVSGSTEAQIEGVPASETLGLYGGDVPDDNSGSITYVSIRHGGTVLSGGSEINGLTLGGVGSGTVIDNIEIFGNVDDGVEFFGGTVNVTNLLVTYQGDDAIDIDQAYAGTLDGFIVIHGGDTDEGLEIDGPEGTENATGKFTLKNGTLIGDPSQESDASSLADFKSRAQGSLENIVFTGYTAGKEIRIASSYDAGCTPTADAYKNLVDDNLIFSNVQFVDYAIAVYASSGTCDTTAETAIAGGKVTSAEATGAPGASTWSWTLTFEKALLP